MLRFVLEKAGQSNRSSFSLFRQFSSAKETLQNQANDDRDTRISLSQLPSQFLRASDPSNFDKDTFQRNDVKLNVLNGKPEKSVAKASESFEIVECKHNHGQYRVKWNDGRQSEYSTEWVDHAVNRWTDKVPEDRVLWRNLSETDFRSNTDTCIDFPDLIATDGMRHAIQTLYRYGILLVSNTPVDDSGEGVAALGAALGGGEYKNQTSLLTRYRQGEGRLQLDHGTDGPLRTLYGTVWSTSSTGQAQGSSIADSAYGHEALPLHTDMTYLRDPPGLQIFTMVSPAESGGESIFGDGFAAAELLRQSNPQAFETLCQIPRRYRCIDKETGWHLEATGPVISTVGTRVVGIRHNDLDRLPDLPHSQQQQEDSSSCAFYERLVNAHEAWDAILGQDDTRLVVKLQKGDTVVVANQRCFHGRCAFTSTAPRAVRGCYVAQDELNSRFRMAGYHVE